MRIFVSLFLALAFAAPSFGADDYPNKPVRVVVPWPPGTSTDIAGRIMADQLSSQFGKSFFVDNRAGASARIGTTFVARSAPDGYTLLVVASSFTVVPGLYKALDYDPIKDFAPVSQFMRVPMVLVISPTVKANTLAEFVALARTKKLTYASAGVGSPNQMAAEFFSKTANIELLHVPYKGGGEMTAGLLGGQVDMMITTVPTVLPLIQSGKLRALAVTTDGRREPTLPDVPSMREAGVPDATVYVWFGIVGPAGMPADVVGRLHAEMTKALAAPSFKSQVAALGGEVVGSPTPDAFGKFIRTDLQSWSDLIKSRNIKADE